MPPDSSDRSAPRTPWGALVAAAVVVPTVLAGLTLAWPRPQIESALAGSAEAALTAAGISGATVHFDGRDATITGVSDGAAAQAVRAVEAATGVRVAQVTPGGGAGAPPMQALPATSAATVPSSAATATAAGSPSASTTAPAPGGQELDAAAKQALQAKIAALTSSAPIAFQPDSPQLTPQGRATLAQVVAAVHAVPAARMEIDGYVATGRGNGLLTAQELSDQRAAVVRDAMVAGGVPADHLTARGRGEDSAATVRAYGRRVEVTVV